MRSLWNDATAGDIAWVSPIVRQWKSVYNKMMYFFINDWHHRINKPEGRCGKGRNKLRNYGQFKVEYYVENYCKLVMVPKHMSALCKFRYGVAPIKIETGRFQSLAENERLYYNVYASIRQPLLDTVNLSFHKMSNSDKMSLFFVANYCQNL